jgi:hypothetical protein
MVSSPLEFDVSTAAPAGAAIRYLPTRIQQRRPGGVKLSLTGPEPCASSHRINQLPIVADLANRQASYRLKRWWDRVKVGFVLR